VRRRLPFRWICRVSIAAVEPGLYKPVSWFRLSCAVLN
jgi:hypothetical protein